MNESWMTDVVCVCSYADYSLFLKIGYNSSWGGIDNNNGVWVIGNRHVFGGRDLDCRGAFCGGKHMMLMTVDTEEVFSLERSLSFLYSWWLKCLNTWTTCLLNGLGLRLKNI